MTLFKSSFNVVKTNLLNILSSPISIISLKNKPNVSISTMICQHVLVDKIVDILNLILILKKICQLIAFSLWKDIATFQLIDGGLGGICTLGSTDY